MSDLVPGIPDDLTKGFLGELGKTAAKWLATLSTEQARNLADIFRRAIRRREAIGEPSGPTTQVRVVKQLIDQGSLRDDPVVREYYGGLFHRSTIDPRDDRAAKWMAQVEQLSQLEIRLHFAIYRSLYKKHSWQNKFLHSSRDRRRHKIEVWRALGLNEPSQAEYFGAISHAASGLYSVGLIEDN